MIDLSSFRGLRAFALPAIAALGLTACDDDSVTVTGETDLPSETLLSVVRNGDGVSTLSAAIDAAGLNSTLVAEGPFTVFAPVDEAFATLPEGTLDALLAEGNADVLADLLTYHVVPGRYTAADLQGGATLQTAEGRSLTVATADGVTVNGRTVLTADLQATNGVIHLIDGVLTEAIDAYDRAKLTPETATLAAAIDAAGLAATLEGEGPFTIFAPVNAAFAGLDTDDLLAAGNVELLQKVLTYHVVPGDIRAADLVDGQTATTVEGSEVTIDLEGGAKVNGANIVATDIEVANGVIHLIDGVLTENLNVVERAIVTPQTATLQAAVVAAGLGETLAGAGPFTVFAPVNEAFLDLDTQDLLDPANVALLQKVLTYHVVPGDIRAADLVDGATVTTVQGAEVTIDLDGGPKVNGANIIATDIQVGNGVVHLIDEVILENLNIVERAIVTPATQTLQEAVIAADLAETLSSDGPFTIFAPTNEAFAALPEGTLETLLQPENIAELQAILTYHALPTEVRAADLVDGARVATVQGGEVVIDLEEGPKVNDANIVVTDIVTSNGVIHVIDAVILPPSS